MKKREGDEDGGKVEIKDSQRVRESGKETESENEAMRGGKKGEETRRENKRAELTTKNTRSLGTY